MVVIDALESPSSVRMGYRKAGNDVSRACEHISMLGLSCRERPFRVDAIGLLVERFCHHQTFSDSPASSKSLRLCCLGDLTYRAAHELRSHASTEHPKGEKCAVTRPRHRAQRRPAGRQRSASWSAKALSWLFRAAARLHL